MLLPAFHCPTVVDPILKAGYQPRFYTISENLSVDVEDFSNKLDEHVVAAVVINYLGFPTDLEVLMVACQDAGAILIEDCAHSFLYGTPPQLAGARGHASIFSFKKLVPTRVGGGIRVNDRDLRIRKPTIAPPLRDTAVNCKRILEQAIGSLDDDSTIRTIFERLEAHRVHLKRKRAGLESSDPNDRVVKFDYPFNERLAASRMPWYARRILSFMPLEVVAKQRRENYRRLLDGLSHTNRRYAVYDTLPDSVCPWAFPMLVPNRAHVDIRLRNEGVALFTFGETLHPALAGTAQGERKMVDQAQFLSASMLCIAIQQGLTAADLSTACSLINDLLR